jgi:hypothetical protein
VTKEDDLVGGSERQVDKETVGCDVGVTKEYDLVGGSERQVEKETVGVMRSSSLVTPTSHPLSLYQPASQIHQLDHIP